MGMGFRLHGGVSIPRKLWYLLERKQYAEKEFLIEHFNIDTFYHPNNDKNGTVSN